MEFEKALQLIEAGLSRETFAREPGGLYEPINYTLGNGGKRIRPALVIMACSVFSDHPLAAVRPALGIEILHNFTLLHDDIMDKAVIRRGKPPVHLKWDDNTAILSGDAMLILAYTYIAASDSEHLPFVLDEFSKVGLEICEGQQYDMSFESRSDVAIEEYINMIRLKTAVLLGSSLKIGAIIGGADQVNAELLYDFGINIGLAFQLMDDVLDVYADKALFGKEPGGDITANKKTFLLLKALELSNKDQKKALEGWLNAKTFDKNEKYLAVRGIYDALNVKQLAENEMDRYFKNGIASLNKVNGNKLALSDLMDVAGVLMRRIK